MEAEELISTFGVQREHHSILVDIHLREVLFTYTEKNLDNSDCQL